MKSKKNLEYQLLPLLQLLLTLQPGDGKHGVLIPGEDGAEGQVVVADGGVARADFGPRSAVDDCPHDDGCKDDGGSDHRERQLHAGRPRLLLPPRIGPHAGWSLCPAASDVRGTTCASGENT